MTIRASKALVLTFVAATLPACATVDVASMTAPAARAEAPAEANVVRRAVAKLKTAFTQRGFGPNASQRKMQAAADLLLNGINRDAAVAEAGYADQTHSAAVVTADILVATRHVNQATRAAEVYLEMAPGDRRLDGELAELEAALLVSEKACKTFAKALSRDDTSELAALRSSVDDLRDVTDAFGFRVRRDRMADAAAETATS